MRRLPEEDADVRHAASARQHAAVPADAAPLVAMRLHVHDIRLEAGPWMVHPHPPSF